MSSCPGEEAGGPRAVPWHQAACLFADGNNPKDWGWFSDWFSTNGSSVCVATESLLISLVRKLKECRTAKCYGGHSQNPLFKKGDCASISGLISSISVCMLTPGSLAVLPPGVCSCLEP